MFDRLKRNWFLCSIVLVIFLAKLWPWFGSKQGPLMPDYTVKYAAVFIIFFNSGLSIKTEEFSKALFQVEVHAFIQSFTLLFIPMLVRVLVMILAKSEFDGDLLVGLQVVSCMPPPVSSAVILTKAAEGNTAVAIFNSAFGSFIGIVVTPLLLLMLVGTSGSVPLARIFTQLSSTVVLPLIIGSLVRNRYKEPLEKLKVPYSLIGNLVLLLIIYTTFCDTFASSNFSLDSYNLFQIAFLILTLQSLLLVFTFRLASHPLFGAKLGFDPTDVVAIIFCSTHKSLTLGIPMLKIIYHGDPSLPVLSIPLLIYHPTQILLGGTLVPWVRKWVKKQVLVLPHQEMPNEI